MPNDRADPRRGPRIQGLAETALFVGDVGAARAFYEEVLGLELLHQDGRGCLFALPGRQLLLLVAHAVTGRPSSTPGGTVPACGATGSMHVAFAIAHRDVERWRERLAEHGVEVEGEVTWERGGRSLYFRDPEGHLLELATPGIWETF